jgi:hypothetical protein
VTAGRGRARRTVTGWVVTLVGLAVATAGLLPYRSPGTTATPAMVLLVPVAIGVAVGGSRPCRSASWADS